MTVTREIGARSHDKEICVASHSFLCVVVGLDVCTSLQIIPINVKELCACEPLNRMSMRRT